MRFTSPSFLNTTFSALVLLSFSCGQGNSRALKPTEFEEKISERSGTVLDVRTPEEFAKGHLLNAWNVNTSDSSLTSLADTFDKGATYYVYGHSQGQSHEAAQLLEKKGIKNVYELEGGYENWILHHKPIVRGNQPPQKEISMEEFQKIISSDTLTLIDFSARWCGPCKKMAPMIEKMVHDRAPHVKVYTIDVDDNPTVSQKNDVEYLPTLVWYKSGKVLERIIGFHSEKEMDQITDKFLKK